jgi:predicted PhzF superfamily epimerase YddE/YHI9
MDPIYVLHVFTDENGRFGNRAAVMVDEYGRYDRIVRQRMAARSGLSEIVFINGKKDTRISIYSPQKEIAFAGHAAVGTAYFFFHFMRDPIRELNTIAGPVKAWQENGITWVRGSLKNAPAWNLKELSSPAEVDAIRAQDAARFAHTMVWAWKDREQKIIRARTFAPDWGIAEDEANGSGAMLLASFLKTDITVIHGKGSRIFARPEGSHHSCIGGTVGI